MNGMSTQVPQEQPQIMLTLPRETFEMAKGFIAGLGQAIAAAEAKLKADEKAAKADMAMADIVNTGADLAGFGQELSAASDNRLGLSSQI